MKNTKKNKKLFLDQLEKSMIIQIACEKTGISKSTIYRWRESDKEFDNAVEDAIREGISFVNGIAETQLVNAIKDRNMTGITLWLKTHHPSYKTKIEVSGEIKNVRDELTEEEAEIIAQALKLAGFDSQEITNNHLIDDNNQKNNEISNQ
ncbi:MAG: hypothetical protein WCO09_03355 [bacterium]